MVRRAIVSVTWTRQSPRQPVGSITGGAPQEVVTLQVEHVLVPQKLPASNASKKALATAGMSVVNWESAELL